MKTVRIEVAHALPVEEALRRVEALVSYWTAKYRVHAAWAGRSARVTGSAMGVVFEAQLEVGETAVSGEATDPGPLLRGAAQKYLERKLGRYLDPATPVESPQRG